MKLLCKSYASPTKVQYEGPRKSYERSRQVPWKAHRPSTEAPCSFHGQVRVPWKAPHGSPNGISTGKAHWNSHRTYSWLFCRIPTDIQSMYSPPQANGRPMERLWKYLGRIVEVPWKYYGGPMQVPWHYCGRLRGGPWQVHRRSMEVPRKSLGKLRALSKTLCCGKYLGTLG